MVDLARAAITGQRQTQVYPRQERELKAQDWILFESFFLSSIYRIIFDSILESGLPLSSSSPSSSSSSSSAPSPPRPQPSFGLVTTRPTSRVEPLAGFALKDSPGRSAIRPTDPKVTCIEAYHDEARPPTPLRQLESLPSTMPPIQLSYHKHCTSEASMRPRST